MKNSKTDVNGYYSKSQRVKIVINWLNSNCYFHRFVYDEKGNTFKDKIIIRLDDYMTFEHELKKFRELFITAFFSISYYCQKGGNYIVIEIK